MLWDSGELTVPATVDPVGEVVSIPVPNIAVTTGDTIAFYGEGYPLTTQVRRGHPELPGPGGTRTGRQHHGGGWRPELPHLQPDAHLLLRGDRPGRLRRYSLDSGDGDGIRQRRQGGFEASLVRGSGYTFPTISFDAPDAPDGVQATAHVEQPRPMVRS